MAHAVTKATRISEIMTTDPVTVSPSDNLREVARIFDANEISGAPVIDGSGQAIGVISRTDIMHHLLAGRPDRRDISLFELIAEGVVIGRGDEVEAIGHVEDAMTTDPLTMSPDDPISQAARRMAQAHVHRILIVSESQGLLGIVTSMDILRVFPH